MSSLRIRYILSFLFIVLTNIANAQDAKINSKNQSYRIISLDNSATEILCQLGLADCIIGRNATSLYPADIQKVISVGNHENLNAEAILGLKPTHIVINDQVKPEKMEQLKQVANILILKIPNEMSEEGCYEKYRFIAQTFKKNEIGEKLIVQLKGEFDSLKARPKTNPMLKTMCLYIRGKGTMLMLGSSSCAVNITKLAGGDICYPNLIDPKPLTAEALVEANPDVIIVFESGLSSIGGLPELLKIQGVSLTTAGKAKHIISVDGQLLSAFGPRTGKTLLDLNEAIYSKKEFVEIKVQPK